MSGCAVLLPIVLTVWILWWFLEFFDGAALPVPLHARGGAKTPKITTMQLQASSPRSTISCSAFMCLVRGAMIQQSRPPTLLIRV